MIRKWLILLCLCFLGVKDSHATPPSTLTLSQLETALNRLTTLKARFQQTGRKGALTSGWFFWERPGKVRFDYDDPNPNLIIAENGPLYHVDKELKERSEIPRSNPLYLFLKKTISFRQKRTRILFFAKKEGAIQLMLAVNGESGTLTLFFDVATLHLQRWILEDDARNQTIIELENCIYGEKFPPTVFQLIKLPKGKFEKG
ncbi:MAG: outer membrane lipoprotein carrier protein LolA [Holosporales bacterium]|jgi:outer membrane lipoprotein-sorting protein|nr:outer membrane lipoprotein carrier protein LolA [Holosporales bacterium]